jgi:hypothetical protein
MRFQRVAKKTFFGNPLNVMLFELMLLFGRKKKGLSQNPFAPFV